MSQKKKRPIGNGMRDWIDLTSLVEDINKKNVQQEEGNKK
jgi:hypothetical protein